ncbi:MAG: hypothetical protein MI744_01215, partial [Pseudomonadales bacterium]|nr:hypothetical protein [Pseudomonadales bacterium]
MKVKLKKDVFRLKIPNNTLPEGIIAITMLDNAMRPVAERLYFNERLRTRLKIELSTDKDIYEKREQTNVIIKTSNSEGEAVNANLSLLAINKQQMGKMQNMRQNILSWFLLDSELKGEIENPGFYFNSDSSMHKHLDALMLTQGWRKYNFTEPYRTNSFQPESNLTVTGHVSSALSKKKKKAAKLTLATFGKNRTAYVTEADSLGKFTFNLLDEYGQKINVLIQSSKKSGKKINYNITLDKNESPHINFNHKRSVAKLDSVAHVFVEKNKERKKIDDAFPLQEGNILIEEVVVEGYHMTPVKKKVFENYGMPDEIIKGESILEKEEKWSYGLYSVLLFNYPDKIIIRRNRNGDLYAKVRNRGITLVLIDGIPLKPYEYVYIQSIPPSEVTSFEIIEYAKNFPRLYCEVFPEKCKDAPLEGSVISIYTHGGKGI